jgi:hypothetical protein
MFRAGYKLALLTTNEFVVKFRQMKTLLVLTGLCLLAVLCWPLALGVLVLLPVVWLVLLPFRFVAIVIEALFAFITTLLFLPARLLGWRRAH